MDRGYRSLMRALTFACIGSLLVGSINADVPANLTVENIPNFSPKLRAEAARYMEFRMASFSGWHPERREMLIATRFADTAQLHSVKMAGGARKQITFGSEPIRGGSWQPKLGKCILYAQDTGGVAYFAHIGGFVCGVIFIALLSGMRGPKRREPPPPWWMESGYR